jgi:hypothetical protein
MILISYIITFLGGALFGALVVFSGLLVAGLKNNMKKKDPGMDWLRSQDGKSLDEILKNLKKD